MNAFYETHRDDAAEIHTKRNGNHTYPSHFHRSIELFIIKRGNYSLTVNGITHEMTDGSVAFIDCFDVHSYEMHSEQGDDCVILIPFSHVYRFNSVRESTRIRSSIIKDSELSSRLLALADGFLIDESDTNVRASTAELMLSLILGRLEPGEERERGEAQLVRSMLTYIQDNFKREITRADIARTLGYSPEHVSRIFHKYLGRSLKDYINSLRIEYIDYERSLEGAPTLTELIYKAGFGSEQTYYRAKKKENREIVSRSST